MSGLGGLYILLFLIKKILNLVALLKSVLRCFNLVTSVLSKHFYSQAVAVIFILFHYGIKTEANFLLKLTNIRDIFCYNRTTPVLATKGPIVTETSPTSNLSVSSKEGGKHALQRETSLTSNIRPCRTTMQWWGYNRRFNISTKGFC
jgi:hypothetical protein